MAERILAVGALRKFKPQDGSAARMEWLPADSPAPTILTFPDREGGSGWILVEQVPEQEQADAG